MLNPQRHQRRQDADEEHPAPTGARQHQPGDNGRQRIADGPTALNNAHRSTAPCAWPCLRHQSRARIPFAAHPNPRKNRSTASMVTDVENPQANVNSEYVRMLRLSMRRRPKRSARKPKPKLPIADAISVKLFKKPAVALFIPNSRISVASTIEYSITSKASSIQPKPAAITVRRCAEVVFDQLNAICSKTIG